MAEKKYPLVYRGSVKDIRSLREPGKKSPGRYLFEFTDDYSVFDYGKMPDRIRGKGTAIAMMTAHLFEALEDPSAWQALFRRGAVWKRIGGRRLKNRLARTEAAARLVERGLQTHYVGVRDSRGRVARTDRLAEPANAIVVKAVPILAPEPLRAGERVLWDYTMFHQGVPQFLVPLENVFRFGVPRGSSLLDRLRENPSYLEQIGLDRVPEEGEWLPHPVLEFFSKLEPMDRHLGWEEALNYCGLPGRRFLELADLTELVGIFLHNLFLEKGLDLWDGKLEFVKTGTDLLLADSITPDELRITLEGTQLSKEPLRQYYKKQDRPFVEAMGKIKKEPKAPASIPRAVKARMGRGPRRLDPAFREIVEQMYRSLTYRVTGSPFFADAMDLETVVRRLRSW